MVVFNRDVQSKARLSVEKCLLSVRLSFVDDGQEEGRRLIGTERGRNNQVLGWFQPKDLHHLTCIQEPFTLGYRCTAFEEGGWELSSVSLILQQQGGRS